MAESWKTKLHALSEQEPDEGRLRTLVGKGRLPSSDVPDTPGTGNRLIAGFVGSVTFVVLVVAVSLAWINVGGGSAPPVDVPRTGRSESDVPAPTDQVIGYHGLLLTVPASWAINDEMCGTPKSDTVLRDLGGVLACLIPRPPGISSVEIVEDPGYRLSEVHRTETFTNGNGVRIERGKAPDQPGTAIYVPAVDVLMIVDTVSEARSNAIVDSIELADTDPNGCAMRERQLDPPASYEAPAAMQDVLIPGSPAAIAICHYVDNWLLSSVTLAGDEMSRFVRVVNGLQEGAVHAPPETYDPSFCDEPWAEGGELGSGYVVWVMGTDPAPLPLWAHVGICGDLGIANGAREGRLTPEFAKVLNDPLHHGYVMPGRLVPGSSGD